MLKRVVITNHLGESMEYRIDGVEVDNPSGLIITSIDGLGPVKANINMLDLATTDGQTFNSARLSGRNIVIKALFTHATSIEEARLLSYKYFPIKKRIKFHIETDNRIGEAEGYVESNEPDIFSEESSCQISILCENPYFDGGKIGYTFGDTIPLFKFAFGNESLDEPLIKLSEEAEVTDERRIIYNGDADTGMEIEVGLPSDDVMDTFKVTGIEITGNDGQKIGIDTSKMVNQVPNTAPNQLRGPNCFFIYETDRYKFLKSLPFGSTGGPIATVVFRGELYIFGGNTNDYSVDNQWVYKWDGNNFVFITKPPLSAQGANIVEYDDAIHFIRYDGNDYSSAHYKWDGSEWTLVDRFPLPTHYGGQAIVFNNEIHVLGGYGGAVSDSEFRHYRWGSTQQRWILDSTRLPREYYDYAKRAVVYNDEIHIFYDSPSSGSSSDMVKIHYKRGKNSSTWEYVGGGPPEGSTSCTNIKSVNIYNNQIHLFRLYGNIYQPCKHYVLRNNVWVQLNDVPISENVGLPCIITKDDYMYIIGGYTDSNGYTEEANNIKLIENDRLVINTNKGKKSVTLYRDDNKYNVINSLEKGSTWLQLHRGVNNLSYSAETGADDMQITISTNKWYEGV